MINIQNYREKYYQHIRYVAVFIVGPILICKGMYYNDKILITIAVLMIFWDGLKLYYN